MRPPGVLASSRQHCRAALADCFLRRLIGAGFAKAIRMKRVMVVEDDVDIRRGVVDALELEGYEVVEAGDGREALRKLRELARPAAIVLDLMMPGMNGWQFRDEQQRDPELARIPVIVVSARMPDDSMPATTYVAKPFGVDTLLDAIVRCSG